MKEDRLIEEAASSRLSQAASVAASIAGRPGQPERPPCDDAFDAVYATYAPLLRKIAVRKFHIPRGDADGLVHDVFATYLTHPQRVRELHPYLIGGICNAARRYWQRTDAERAMFCDGEVCAATPDDALLDSVVRSLLLAATLARLGPSCRETLQRFYLQGESAASIAATRSTTQNSILQLLHYCRARARAAYQSLNEVS